MGYLGLKDATRKQRPISQTPGEWTGSITISLEGVVLFIMVSEKKRNKEKQMIAEFLSQLVSSKAHTYFCLKDM